MEPSYAIDDLLELAVAIADPTERPIFLKRGDTPHSKDRDGSASSIRGAFESHRPFAIKIDGRILVIDDDKGIGFDEFIGEHLGAFEPVVTRSGPNPHRGHLLVVIEVPEERAAIANAAREMFSTVSEHGCWLRPPGAPHTEGGICQLVDVTPAEATRRLSRMRTTGLKHKGTRALYEGMSSGLFKSPSEALQSATLALVNLGWDADAIFWTLLDQPGGESLQKRINDKRWSREQARRWFEQNTLAKARSYAELSPVVRDSSDVDAYLRGIEAWISHRPWRGVGGTNDLAALRVILDMARTHRRLHAIGISTRHLAEQANLGSHSTASRSLDRLTKLGVIEYVPHAALPPDDSDYLGPKSKRYTLQVPPLTAEEQTRWADAATSPLLEQSGPGGCVSATVPVESDMDRLRHDAFRRDALGKQALRVLERLNDTPQTGAAIARGLKLSAATVRQHLRKLVEAGLATRLPSGWIIASRDLDEVAKLKGSAGAGARLKETHRQQRKANNAKMAKLRETTGAQLFIEAHLRRGTRSHSLKHSDVLDSYHVWCRNSASRAYREPDRNLIAEIRQRVRGAEFTEEPTNDRFRRTTGTWIGLRLVNPPRDTVAPTVLPGPLVEAPRPTLTGDGSSDISRGTP